MHPVPPIQVTNANETASAVEDSALSVGAVVLTDGRRSQALGEMAETLAQQPLEERILVANGTEVSGFDNWTVVHSATNLGVPGGRALGIAASKSDVLIFLDDDALARSPDLTSRTRARFENDRSLGALAFRVVVTGTEESISRWTPAHGGDGIGSADAATFPGGGHALRVEAFQDVGGYTNQFFFKHEETELAWKLIDGGWNVLYDPKLVVEHPRTSETRNPVARFNGTRNKLWLARLHLPRPLSWVAMSTATALAVVKSRSLTDLRAVASGTWAGLRELPTQRQPIRWSTVRSLGRRGRWPTR